MNKLAALSLLVFSVAHAESMDVKLKDVDDKHDTTLIIQKGKVPGGPLVENGNRYEIVQGDSEEIVGDPQNDRAKAYASWQEACNEWKKAIKDLNQGNQVLVSNCGRPQMSKDPAAAHMNVYRSLGTYKLKVRIYEANPKK